MRTGDVLLESAHEVPTILEPTLSSRSKVVAEIRTFSVLHPLSLCFLAFVVVLPVMKLAILADMQVAAASRARFRPRNPSSP